MKGVLIFSILGSVCLWLLLNYAADLANESRLQQKAQAESYLAPWLTERR